MTSSYPPAPYPSLIHSTTPSTMRLLVPMPIPRTHGAPYFDERGVSSFLNLILQHGSNAGINDADQLVSFIVRYSSDRVREIIQYIPEIDVDEPNRTWNAAKEQMLLLYGSQDDERRVSEAELIEFCRQRSDTSPYRTKREVERYLRDFQWIAAPLLKQQDITIKERDFYFVSGIPTSIKQWFIFRVPEPFRTRSNPPELADSLGILYGYFDPDALFPDIWNDLKDSSESASTIPASTSLPTPPPSSALTMTLTPFHHAIHPAIVPASAAFPSTTLFASTQPRPEPESVPTPVPSTTALFAFDKPESPRIQEIDPDADYRDHLCDDSNAEENLKVPPCDELPDSVVYRVDLCAGGGRRIVDRRCEERPVYFCGSNEMTDDFSELHPVLEYVATSELSTDEATELSPVLDPHEYDCVIADESRAGFIWS
ncbi:hypothetical protein B0H19DRAFT_1276842 [Mycena capillaripes]|nr:hypothetical protein B0H19DRAFT_1276842 [Mycena capillaripes]